MLGDVYSRVEQLVMPGFLAAIKRSPNKAEAEDQAADPVPDRAAEAGAPKAQASRLLPVPSRGTI